MKKKNFAFTLAEVLITLGVIGVVAAMTMPSVIQHFRKQAWVNQLKKSVSTIENGFKMAIAKDGVDNLENTELNSVLNGNPYNENNMDANFENKLKEYINIVSIVDIDKSDYKFTNGNTCPFKMCRELLLSDGSSIIVNCSGPTLTAFVPTVDNIAALIDVNSSHKGPNQFGRDMFNIRFNKNGNSYVPNNIGNISNECKNTGVYCAHIFWKTAGRWIIKKS